MVVKLPDASDLGALPSADSGRPISSVDTSAIGAGIAKLGAGALELGDAAIEGATLQNRQAARLQMAQARAYYLTQKVQLESDLTNEPPTAGNTPTQGDTVAASPTSALPNYVTMTSRYQDGTAKIRDAAAAMITDPTQRKLFIASTSDDIARGSATIATQAKKLQSDATIADVNQRLEDTRQAALQASDPATRAQLVQNGTAMIQGLQDNGYISPTQAQAVRQKWVEDYAEAAIKIMPPQEQVAVLSGGDDIASKIINAESGGRNDAANPNSSARGAGQFTDSTWNAFLKARHPELVGKGDTRNDPALSREAVGWYAEQNAAVLKQHGLPVNDGSLYLAHFLGPQGAVSMLGADPNAPAAQVDPQAAAANKSVFYNKDGSSKSVGEIVGWASGKMGIASSNVSQANSNLVRFLPEDKRVALLQDAADQSRAIIAQQVADSYLNGTMPPIGTAPVASDQATPAPTLAPGTNAAPQAGVTPLPSTVGNAAPTLAQTHDSRANFYATKASLLDDISRRYAGNPQMEAAVRERVNQGLTERLALQQAQEQERLANQSAVMDDYLKPAMQGQPIAPLVQKLANDPRAEGIRDKIYNALQTFGHGKAYGSSFYTLFQQIHSNGNGQITDPATLLPMVDGEHLTLEGYDKLRSEMGDSKSTDTAALVDMRKSALAYIKHNLTFEADYGTFKLRDPVGEDIFNSQAVPAFYKAFTDGLAHNKTPYQLLTKGSPDFIGDKIIDTFKRAKAQEMKDRITAGADALNAGTAAPVITPKFDLTKPEGIVAAYKAGNMSYSAAAARLRGLGIADGAAPAPAPAGPQVPISQ